MSEGKQVTLCQVGLLDYLIGAATWEDYKNVAGLCCSNVGRHDFHIPSDPDADCFRLCAQHHAEYTAKYETK